MTSARTKIRHPMVPVYVFSTVETKHPRAQNPCPTKFLFRLAYVRLKWIALLPLLQPITCDTGYFGGIEIIICT